ncbi:restriction endonuclease subunit S [Bifidobacterium angulatum]|uniref:restriction endonuclease subunit S n=1 Tax=Bifidobacterium angulatum TaxID=1683 RepID=UPI00265A7799|nr:restriction endonuclease subunit S [Bifidobacterium angulatum]
MAEQHGKTLVPQIRFAGFTDPWEQRKLGDVANVCSGRDYKHLAEGPIPVYGTGGYMTSVSKALSYDEDAIGIGRKGTIDKPYRLQAPFWTVDTLFYAIPEASSDINFLLCSFLNVDWKSKDESTGLPSLSKRAINETEVLVPDNGEQRQIGAFFDRLDSLITLHQRKYDKLCVLKKSMLDKMFPKGGSLYPEIRFAGFTDPWEQRKLGDVARRVTRKNENRDSDLPLTISAQYGLVDQRTFFNNQVASKDMSGYFLLHKGEFAYNKSTSTDSPWGAIKRLEKYDMGCVSTLYICFELLSGDPDFLVTYYETDRWYKAVQLIAAEGARNHGLLNIAPDDFFETQICIPKRIDEQRQIGAFFDRLDSLITLHQRKLELLRNIKKSMLDKMFV